MTLVPAITEEYDMVDHYWENLLLFVKKGKCEKNISKLLELCGKWSVHNKNGKTIEFVQLRKSHLKPEYHAEYDLAVIEYYKNNKE